MLMKTFVFGDTGGHAPQLQRALIDLGVDLELAFIPDNVRIIHLGDIIHKGEHSDSLVGMIDRLIRNNPGQWVQLLGNHEFQHIEGAPYFWNCNCTVRTVNILNEWWEEGLATATYALPTPEHLTLDISGKVPQPNTSILFSHAGLSWQWWNAIAQPNNAEDVSLALNSLPVEFITAPGEMLGVRGGNPGPVWAVGNTEVFNSWYVQETVMPFTQIHGHTSSYKWIQNEWWRKDPAFRTFRDATKLNPETRAVITSMADNLLIGIDPGYSKNASTLKQPYLTILN